MPVETIIINNTYLSKGKSPFYPGQPVPVELFVGRAAALDRIKNRGVGQVAAGKPIAIYIQGEYGIGKSSLAGYVQSMAEREYGLHGIYTSLSTVQSLDDVAAAVLAATVRSGAFDPRRSEKVRNWLAKYIGEQSLFGVNLNLQALKRDAPTLTSISEMLEFLKEVVNRLGDTGVNGVFLVLDEINGATSDPMFAHFIKGLVDTNAMARQPLPLLLMLCGVEERRREMIRHHQPVDRIFDVIEIEPMTPEEMQEFFKRAFESVQMAIEPKAMELLTHYSGGFPKIMHLVGDSAYWLDKDGVISEEDASNAILLAADEVGKKYVDQQVYAALRSADYHSILDKIAKSGLKMEFSKAEVARGLSENERRKLPNFLQRMKRLNVLRSGEVQGEYVFNSRMVRLYLWLTSILKEKRPS